LIVRNHPHTRLGLLAGLADSPLALQHDRQLMPPRRPVGAKRDCLGEVVDCRLVYFLQGKNATEKIVPFRLIE